MIDDGPLVQGVCHNDQEPPRPGHLPARLHPPERAIACISITLAALGAETSWRAAGSSYSDTTCPVSSESGPPQRSAGPRSPASSSLPAASDGSGRARDLVAAPCRATGALQVDAPCCAAGACCLKAVGRDWSASAACDAVHWSDCRGLRSTAPWCAACRAAGRRGSGVHADAAAAQLE